METSLAGVTAADFDDEAREEFVQAVIDAMQSSAGVQLRRGWVNITSVVDVEAVERRALSLSPSLSLQSLSLSSSLDLANTVTAALWGSASSGQGEEEKEKWRVLNAAGVLVTFDVEYIAETICFSCADHDMTAEVLKTAFSRNDVARAVESNLQATSSALGGAVVQGVGFGAQAVLASPTFAPTPSPELDAFDPTVLAGLVVIPVVAYLLYEYTNHKRRKREKAQFEEEQKVKVEMKRSVFYDEESGLFSLGPEPAGPEQVASGVAKKNRTTASAGAGAGEGVLPFSFSGVKRSRKRRVAPHSVEAMVAYSKMESNRTNWLYKVAPDPASLRDRSEEAKHCSGDDPTWQDAFDILVAQVARGEFKESVGDFVADVAMESLREEKHEQRLQRRSAIGSKSLLSEFKRGDLFAAVVEEAAREAWEEERAEAEMNYRAAVVTIPVFKEFRVCFVEEIVAECLAEEVEEATLLNRAAVAAQVVLKQAYREHIEAIIQEVLVEESLAEALCDEAVHALSICLVEEEHDSGHFAMPDAATRMHPASPSTATSSLTTTTSSASSSLSGGALSAGEAGTGTGAGMSVDDYHAHVMEAAGTHIRRKVAYHRRMINEKKEAKARAKEEAQAVVRDVSSASSYLRKKAGYVPPEEEKLEARTADAKTLSSFLSRKNP